jgi:hypothetical protein
MHSHINSEHDRVTDKKGSFSKDYMTCKEGNYERRRGNKKMELLDKQRLGKKCI